MNKNKRSLLTALIFPLMLLFTFSLEAAPNPTASINTNHGTIELELFANKAPITVANFIKYAKSNFYNNTIFHRVIPNFMIQGGGFTKQFERKNTLEPIRNEAGNGLHNSRGTIAMARTNDPNSATSQFFINVVDNAFLDQKGERFGYAVFGKVIKGIEVTDEIAKVQTSVVNGMRDVPSETVLIKSITINHHDFP